MGPLTDFRLHTTIFRLRMTDFRLRSSHFRLRTTDFRLRATIFQLPITAFRLHTTIFWLRMTVFRLHATISRLRTTVFRLRVPRSSRHGPTPHKEEGRPEAAFWIEHEAAIQATSASAVLLRRWRDQRVPTSLRRSSSPCAAPESLSCP